MKKRRRREQASFLLLEGLKNKKTVKRGRTMGRALAFTVPQSQGLAKAAEKRRKGEENEKKEGRKGRKVYVDYDCSLRNRAE